MENRFAELLGKIMLVGITYYRPNGECAGQRQLWGTVISADETGVVLRQSSGARFSLPPDLSSVEPAPPGEYRLRSTGEVVRDPDYLSTWNCELSGDGTGSHGEESGVPDAAGR